MGVSTEPGEPNSIPVIPIGLALFVVTAGGLVTWRIRSRRESSNAAQLHSPPLSRNIRERLHTGV